MIFKTISGKWNPTHSAEQQLSMALQQNEVQQRMITHICKILVAMEDTEKIGGDEVLLLTNSFFQFTPERFLALCVTWCSDSPLISSTMSR
jgi:hypothetical protein